MRKLNYECILRNIFCWVIVHLAVNAYLTHNVGEPSRLCLCRSSCDDLQFAPFGRVVTVVSHFLTWGWGGTYDIRTRGWVLLWMSRWSMGSVKNFIMKIMSKCWSNNPNISRTSYKYGPLYTPTANNKTYCWRKTCLSGFGHNTQYLSFEETNHANYPSVKNIQLNHMSKWSPYTQLWRLTLFEKFGIKLISDCHVLGLPNHTL